MITNNILLYSLKITGEFARGIFYFPVWWYTRGLAQVIVSLGRFLSDREKSLALFIWIRNLFRPMYGQADWQGVLISFFMRIVMIITKSLAMVFWLAIALVLLAVWLVLPAAAIWGIIYQLTGTVLFLE